MKRRQFTEEQITHALKEVLVGAVMTELCGRRGTSSAKHCAWKAKFGGMKVPEPERLQALEEQSVQHKCRADTILDNAGLKSLLKKW